MDSRRAEADTPAADVLTPSRGGPTVLRILLGTQLRRLRQAKGISREDAGYEIRASHAKISRLELGQVKFKERDVADLLTLYGVTAQEERDALLTLARQANTPGWWHKYSDVLPSWFEVYIGLEEAAAVIRTYELQFVPGLLQAEEYARAVIMLGHGGDPVEEVDHRVRLRMTRTERLTGPNPPKLWAVVDEAALRRPIGGPATMRAQIEHLIEMATLPNITLQIIPFHKGGHSAAGGPFSILRFTESDLPDVVYLEQLTSAVYFDKPDDTDRYMEVMDRLCLEALSAPESARYLATILDDFR
ncbi:XRE family transcriptional regulator [Nocardiopsis gilva YIM 90087]|uniref:XRE family transcriptional regulator n=1 Tax=Nocardiopsis gilva YIM 90087 TaxID=1235441 RepID=A0A223S9B8_9ACTN|nr:helix-turn-helix transcriptional regulator [Nocardiopsis gilva]ASU84720.1 XRE family transcriptional regulator [Nocardiopsis gilva YIM 90087]